MGLIDSPLLRVVTGSLDVNAYRLRLAASNLANVDTPGYRTQDVDFHRALADAIARENGRASEAGWGCAEDSVADDSSLAFAPATRKLRGLIERPDGNNVSAEREGLVLALTQLRFTLSGQLAKDEYHKILSAIREGA